MAGMGCARLFSWGHAQVAIARNDTSKSRPVRFALRVGANDLQHWKEDKHELL